MLKNSGIECEARNVFDLIRHYQSYLAARFPEATLHLGKKRGNILEVGLDKLEPVDILIMGPPCPPWSSAGKRRSDDDARATVFHRCLQWAIHFIKSTGLLVLLIENVPGILHDVEDHGNFYMLVIERLREVVPEFLFDIQVATCEDYMLPQTRKRAYIRGMRKSFSSDGLPPPLPAFGRSTLTEFLRAAPNVRRQSLSRNLRINVRRHELAIEAMLRNGEVKACGALIRTMDF